MITNYLLQDPPHRVICVAFENLKKDLIGEVKRMLDFLSIGYTDEQLRGRLLQDFTAFRRSHKRVFDHYTHEQRRFINSFIRSAMLLLKGTAIAGQVPLGSYLRTFHAASQVEG